MYLTILLRNTAWHQNFLHSLSFTLPFFWLLPSFLPSLFLLQRQVGRQQGVIRFSTHSFILMRSVMITFIKNFSGQICLRNPRLHRVQRFLHQGLSQSLNRAIHTMTHQERCGGLHFPYLTAKTSLTPLAKVLRKSLWERDLRPKDFRHHSQAVVFKLVLPGISFVAWGQVI